MFNKVAKLSRRCFSAIAILSVLLFVGACVDNGTSDEGGADFTEKEATEVCFTNSQIYYLGDTAREQSFDIWQIKFYTDMEIDELGNPIGPGSVMQLVLNTPYEESQTANIEQLEGVYIAQSNSGDYSPFTFIYGYLDILELPDGRHEMPDGTFYASLPEGSKQMNIDLLDDGKLEIVNNADGTTTIKGTLVGKQCRKRNFVWRGVVDAKSEVKQEVPNSTIKTDIQIENLTQALMQDKGDNFYLRDESYRDILIFLAEESISFEWGKPVGTGEVLRLELLVPWATNMKEGDGIPAGTYQMMQRNADTSFDKESIVPFRAVSGLPNRFVAPYWSGSWYGSYVDGAWGDSYARIDGGTVTVERGENGSHHFICNLQDCSSPTFSVTTDTTIKNDKIVIY
jgi:hypothetical protein